MSSVSVVMPVFEREGMCGDAIRSVLAQTHADLELVIIDDGSQDGTLDACLAFDDERVRVYAMSHVGMTANVNRCVARATGDYVAFIGSDDVWHPSKLARQLEAIGGAECCFTGITFARDGSAAWRNAVAGGTGPYHLPDVARYTEAFSTFQGNVATGTALVRRDAWIPWHEQIVTGGADMLWVYEMHCRGYRFAVVDAGLYTCRRHPGRQLYRRRAMDQHIVERELALHYWPLVERIRTTCSR